MAARQAPGRDRRMRASRLAESYDVPGIASVALLVVVATSASPDT